MAVEKDDSQVARDERARRLREQIAALNSGGPQPPKGKKSIREQVEEASLKLKRKGKS